jgi:hypothetical protein
MVNIVPQIAANIKLPRIAFTPMKIDAIAQPNQNSGK